MYASPQIIAIDNDSEHLIRLISGLSTLGLPCMPIHAPNLDLEGISLSQVRIVFSDLHLLGDEYRDAKAHYAVIASHLTQLISDDNGPYILCLWTRYAERESELESYLIERLEDARKRPLAVTSIGKDVFLERPPDEAAKELAELLKTKFSKFELFDALMYWESKASRAGSAVVNLLDDLVPGDRLTNLNYSQELSKIVFAACSAAAGKHVENRYSESINEALAPILYDKIIDGYSTDFEKEKWKAAIQKEDEPLHIRQLTQLNRVVHFSFSAENQTSLARGSVVRLPTSVLENFHEHFGMSIDDAANTQMGVKINMDTCDNRTLNRFVWVLIQSQAPCDYSQNKKGLIPFVLGLISPGFGVDYLDDSGAGAIPAAYWCAPDFFFEGSFFRLGVNFRFVLGHSESQSKQFEVIFRLREQLQSDLRHKMHAYLARPGVYSF